MLNVDEIKNKIFNAKSNEILKEFPSSCIDLVITSPPYDDLRDYENKSNWNFDVFKEIAQELYRVVKPGGVVVWIVGDKTSNGRKSLTSFKQALYFEEVGFGMFDVIIYEKAGSGPPHKNRYFNAFEYMFILSKGKPKTINLLRDKPNKWAGHSTYGEVTRREKDGSLTNKGKKVINKFGVRTNIWRYSNGKGFTTKDKFAYEHPAIFPEKLVEDHINSWSNPHDIVLDPFGGSGTTAKMAQLMGRDWVLIEVVQDYCQLAKRRLESIQDANNNIKYQH